MKLFFPQERWEKADLVKNVFLEGFVAFGGGKYQCPGRLEKQTLQSCLHKAVYMHRLVRSAILTATTAHIKTLDIITLCQISTHAITAKLTDISETQQCPASKRWTHKGAKCHLQTICTFMHTKLTRRCWCSSVAWCWCCCWQTATYCCPSGSTGCHKCHCPEGPGICQGVRGNCERGTDTQNRFLCSKHVQEWAEKLIKAWGRNFNHPEMCLIQRQIFIIIIIIIILHTQSNISDVVPHPPYVMCSWWFIWLNRVLCVY